MAIAGKSNPHRSADFDCRWWVCFMDSNYKVINKHLLRVRQLRQAKKSLGVDAIYLFVSDVDGDWLENWTEESVC